MKKIVLKLELQDNWEKKKAMKKVAAHSGIDSISMDMKQKKLTVIGTADPVTIVMKLRKYWPRTDIMLLGPANEPAEKKEGASKKDAEKKEGKKGGEGSEEKKDNAGDEYDRVTEMVRAYKAYNPQMPYHYYVPNMEETPGGCTII